MRQVERIVDAPKFGDRADKDGHVEGDNQKQRERRQRNKRPAHERLFDKRCRAARRFACDRDVGTARDPITLQNKNGERGKQKHER